ncbi:MAG: hypothetical protein AAFQ68_03275, partial [Bacteroidota bacterium]
RFVRSPFFHQHAESIQYFKLLKPAYPAFAEEDLPAERLFAKIYPQESFDDNKLRTLRKYLLKLLYRFLQYEASERDGSFEKHHLLRDLLERNLPDDYQRQAQQIQAELEEQPLRNEVYYQESFYLQRLEMHYNTQYLSRLSPQAFEGMHQRLNDAFVIQKLELYCATLNRQRLRTDAPQADPIRKLVLQYCEQQGEALPDLARAYFYCLDLLRRTKDPEPLAKLLRILQSTGRKAFPEGHKTNLYSHAINYCNDQYRAGKVKYLGKMLDIYRQMLEQELLFENGQLSTHQYKNITTLGLRTGDLAWTEQFIVAYRTRLDPAYREGVYHYNMAHLRQYQQEFSKALQHLQQVDFIDPFYRISYQMLLLKIFYECEEIEPLLALAQTFRTFIRRKEELPKEQQLAYTNFARYLRALFMIKIGKKHKLKALREKIAQSQTLIERQWLEAKADQLTRTAQ